MPASYARLCFAYLGARMIISGHVSLDDFTEAALGDPQTLRLAQRISVQEVPGNDPAAFTPQTLTATRRDGSKVQASTSTLYGSPADPLSRQAHLAKFRACVAFGFGTARAGLTEHLIETVDTLESVEDASLLNRLAAGKEG
jgi:2-methylcitrate dehydratase PrpD